MIPTTTGAMLKQDIFERINNNLPRGVPYYDEADWLHGLHYAGIQLDLSQFTIWEPCLMKQWVDDLDTDQFPVVMPDGSQRYHQFGGVIYETWHPDEIEDDEFNMVIRLPDGMALAISNHFDWV